MNKKFKYLKLYPNGTFSFNNWVPIEPRKPEEYYSTKEPDRFEKESCLEATYSGDLLGLISKASKILQVEQKEVLEKLCSGDIKIEYSSSSSYCEDSAETTFILYYGKFTEGKVHKHKNVNYKHQLSLYKKEKEKYDKEIEVFNKEQKIYNLLFEELKKSKSKIKKIEIEYKTTYKKLCKEQKSFVDKVLKEIIDEDNENRTKNS